MVLRETRGQSGLAGVSTRSDTGGPSTTTASRPAARVTSLRIRSSTPRRPGPTSVTSRIEDYVRARPTDVVDHEALERELRPQPGHADWWRAPCAIRP